MTTQFHGSDPTSQAPASAPLWVGRLSLVLAVAALVLLTLGDPWWLTLPSSLLAIAAGSYALRRGPDNQVAAHIGVNFGIFNLLLWLVVILVVRNLLDYDLHLIGVTAAISA